MMRRGIQQAVRAVFWTLVTCLLCLAYAIPTTLAKLIFGSPF
jgi:hypothetical protein